MTDLASRGDAVAARPTQSADSTVSDVSRPKQAALVVLAATQLMLVLDVTVVNVALPAIAGSLHLSRGAVPWVMTSYTLMFGGLMLLGGRVADLFGARRSTIVGLTAFVLASLVCGLSSGVAVLLVGRAAQGVAAAFLSPAALATVTGQYRGEHRGRALAVWSMISGAGAALGVVLGGVLTTEVGWRWIFAINVPIGAVLLIAIPMVTRAAPRPVDRPSPDLPGAVLVTTGTAFAIYGLISAGADGWRAAATWSTLAAALATWLLFAIVEQRSSNPLLAPALLTRRPSLAGSFLMLVATGLMVGGFFLGSFRLQHAHHFSALQVGMAFLPVAVATVAGAQAASRLLSRLSARIVASAGLAVAATGYALTGYATGAFVAVLGLTLATLGIGATFVTAFTAALTDAPVAEAGLRSALVNTFHELGGAAGVALFSTIAGAALTATHVEPTDFRAAFTAGAVAAATAGVISIVLVPAVRRLPGAGQASH